MTPPLEQTAHRPWPLPERPWVMAMRWHELLFAHWPVRPEVLRPLLPPSLELDTFDGRAWLGVVPFRMSGVRPRYVPERLGFAFPELNVRTYAKSPGRTGVWFFSLDATSWLAVRAARLWYGLPYYDARMRVVPRSGGIAYHSTRVHRGAHGARLKVDYGPVSDVFHAQPGTLDHWLTERYCLYTVDRNGQVRVGEIHHRPWPLQKAEAEFRHNTMAEPLGIRLPLEASILHYARELEVAAWRPIALEAVEPGRE